MRPASSRSRAPTATAWCAGLKARGHRNAIALERSEDLAGLVRGLARPGDYVVCLGAGNITQWAYALAGRARRHRRRRRSAGVFRSHRRSSGFDARSARALARQRFARGGHLVPRRRAGPGAVLAGGRGRSRLFSRAARRPTVPVTVDRARLEPDRARRRRAGRRHPPRARASARSRSSEGARVRAGAGDAGREGRARRRRGRHRRPRLLSRHPGRDRRRACA